VEQEESSTLAAEGSGEEPATRQIVDCGRCWGRLGLAEIAEQNEAVRVVV